MAVMMKCAACGAVVEFEDDSPTAEAVCPGCQVRVRRRQGDEQMAMPVSMVLPDQFQPLDLGRLGRQSEVLMERYKKGIGSEPPVSSEQVEVTLAQALESLAHSIGHLEERLTKQEHRADSGVPGHELGETNGYGEPLAPAGGEPSGYPGYDAAEPAYEEAGVPNQPTLPAGEAVVQLQLEKEKAQPLGASVLVRREAARVAHHYRRESQNHWDDRGRETIKVGLFQRMMERAPKTTVTLSILLALGFVVGTIAWMEFGGVFERKMEAALPGLETTSMGQLWADDRDAAQAEVIARGFLSATSAEVAKPFVYQSDLIESKFDELFQPIETPGTYRLLLQSRAMTPEGGSVFAYRVWMSDEQPRMLVVLPEGTMPKVYWEFFAEVGDYSWGEFMESRPSDPAMLRAWAYKGNRYVAPYGEDQWQCYILHDYTESYVVHAYARRGEGADWSLSNELENKPVKFGRRQEVMAQVSMNFMSEVTNPGEDRIYVAEIKDVPVVSWLPERYLPKPVKKK